MNELVVVTPDQSQHRLSMWCGEEDLPEGRLIQVQDIDRAFAIAVATDLLYTLSGRKYRSGRSIVRPTTIQAAYANQSFLYPYSSMSGYGGAWGFASGWAWTAPGQGWWQNGQDQSELVLMGPVSAVNMVMINGVNLGPWTPSQPNANYTIYDRRRMILNSPGNSPSSPVAWPWAQDLQLDLSQSGTAAVDYLWGSPPPPAGKWAAIELTTELILSMSGDDNHLPGRVVQIASQGVSAAVGDALMYIREELTGLPAVDLFLQAKNPARLRRQSIFIGPDSTQLREQTSYPG